MFKVLHELECYYQPKRVEKHLPYVLVQQTHLNKSDHIAPSPGFPYFNLPHFFQVRRGRGPRGPRFAGEIEVPPPAIPLLLQSLHEPPPVAQVRKQALLHGQGQFNNSPIMKTCLKIVLVDF